MPMRTYEALLTRPESLARVRALESAIRQVSGKVRIAPVSKSNVVAVVTLWLPDPHRPDDFLPDIPFTPVL